MAHGYIGDGYGIDGGHERDRDQDRERGSRDRDWRGGSDGWRDRDRNRGMMFGDQDRGWSDRGTWRDDGSPEQRGRSDSYNRQSEDWSGQRRHTANPDDHYRSWRDRHMSELDSDYQDYCREREQQFHQDFDTWRSQRHANYQPLRTGMTNSGLSHDPSGEVQAATEGTLSETDATDAATLGTNTGQTGSGRGRR